MMPSMPPSTPRLAAHESLSSGNNGVQYIVFRREHGKKPGKVFIQVDVLPLPSSDHDKSTFVTPSADPIPTDMNAEDNKQRWVLNDKTGRWSRGSRKWGPTKFVLRIFTRKGDYKSQLFVGASWKKFDKFVAKFDPNDPEIVEKYNTWLEAVVANCDTEIETETGGYDEEAVEGAEIPWTVNEKIVLRSYVNEFIAQKGLVFFVTDMNWGEESILFNVGLRSAGEYHTYRSEQSILRMFGKDSGIARAVKMGLDLKAREKSGEEIIEEEMRPVDLIPLMAPSGEREIGTVAEDGAVVGGEVDVGAVRPGEERIVYNEEGDRDFEDKDE
jgi:hypothetical protein